jgi:hypothetical protein
LRRDENQKRVVQEAVVFWLFIEHLDKSNSASEPASNPFFEAIVGQAILIRAGVIVMEGLDAATDAAVRGV